MRFEAVDAVRARVLREPLQQARREPAPLPAVDDQHGDDRAGRVARVADIARQPDSGPGARVDGAQREVVAIHGGNGSRIGASEEELPVAVDRSEVLEALLDERRVPWCHGPDEYSRAVAQFDPLPGRRGRRPVR